VSDYQNQQQSTMATQADGERGSRASSADQAHVSDLRETVMEALRILSLRRWVFLVPFCLATTTAFVASQFLPRTYTTSTLFERIDDPVLRELPDGQGAGAFEYFRRTLPRDIKTPEAMGPIVTMLGLDNDLARDADGNLTPESIQVRNDRGIALASLVSVEWWERAKHTDTVELKYRGPDPAVGAPLVEEMRKNYVRLARAKLRETLTVTKEFFEGIAAEHRERVNQLDRELTQFKLDNPGVDPTDPDNITYQRTLLRARLDDLGRERASIESEAEVRRNFLAVAESGDAVIPNLPLIGETLIPSISPAARRLDKQIRTIEQQINELQVTRGMTERHPEIVELRKMQSRYAEQLAQQHQADQLAGLANRPVNADFQLGQGHTTEWDPARLRTQMELVALGDRLADNERAVLTTEKSLARFNEMHANIFLNRRSFMARAEELKDAQVEYQNHKGQAQELARRLNVEEMEKGVQFASIRAAEVSVVPSSPASKTILIMTLLVGAATGTVCVVLSELFDRRFRTVEQVTRSLGVALLECIDEIVTAAERRRRFLRRMVFAPAAGAALFGMTVVSGSLAYLSLESPELYLRVKQFPQTILGFLHVTELKPDELDAGSPALITDNLRVKSIGDIEEPFADSVVQ